MDFCSQCQRRVHNLDALSDAQREAFLSGCSGAVCVSFTVRRKPLLGIGLAAVGALASGAALAQEAVEEPIAGEYCDPAELIEVIVGGTNAGKDLQWLDADEVALPEKSELPEIEASQWLPTPEIT